MDASDADAHLGRVQIQLSDAADRLAGSVLDLDGGRTDCARLAGRFDDFVAGWPRLTRRWPALQLAWGSSSSTLTLSSAPCRRPPRSSRPAPVG